MDGKNKNIRDMYEAVN